MIPSQASGFATYPGEPSVFVAASEWVQATLLGSLATAVAVMAVATVGLLLLTGRVNLKRGLTVIVGCFILFGASSIANGLSGAASSVTNASGERIGAVPLKPTALQLSPQAPAREDPYAGASLRR